MKSAIIGSVIVLAVVLLALAVARYPARAQLTQTPTSLTVSQSGSTLIFVGQTIPNAFVQIAVSAGTGHCWGSASGFSVANLTVRSDSNGFYRAVISNIPNSQFPTGSYSVTATATSINPYGMSGSQCVYFTIVSAVPEFPQASFLVVLMFGLFIAAIRTTKSKY